MGREVAENRSAPRAVTRVLAPAAQGLRAATRPNKRHRAGTILALVALAAGNGTPAGGFLGLGEHAGTAGRTPTAGRARQAMQARDAAGAPPACARRPRATCERRAGAASSPRRSSWRLACTGHTGTGARSRGGSCEPGPAAGRPGGKGTRRRSARPTGCGPRLAPCAPCPATASGPRFPPCAGAFGPCAGGPARGTCCPWTAGPSRPACRGAREARGAPARALPKLPARRGGHSQVHVRGEASRAPDAHPRRAREGGAARHDHKEGEKERGQGPEGKHVAFATNMPSADPDAPCPRRWGTGIGHRTPRQTRMRTSSRDESARTFCFVVSPMARNARAMMRPGRRAGGDGRKIPMTPPRIIIVLEACEGPGIRPPRKPPP